MPDTRAEHDDFYVGYLPAPAGTARLARRLAIGLPLLFAAIAAAIAARQADPGPGTWEQNDAASYRGVMMVDPYPRLEFDAPMNGAASALLVEEGKFGADSRAAAWKGKSVVVRGTLIQRGARAVVELVSTIDAIERDQSGGAGKKEANLATTSREVELTGEIVDPKCYLGVMRPGHGKPHLACAELCISGGIPPVLVVHREGGPEEGECYVLTAPDVSAANGLVRGRVGHTVRVVGDLVAGDWPTIRVREIR